MPGVNLNEMVAHCDELLGTPGFDDYCPNGLQVEAGSRVSLLVSGVTASQALIDAAAQQGADALLVHHGFFWKGESPCITGMKGRRIATLVRRSVSLLAYHLPLDTHRQLGNNAQLGSVLGVTGAAPAGEDGLLWHGELTDAPGLDSLAGSVAQSLGRRPLVLSGGSRPVRRLAWCSGAAQGQIERAAALGADAFLSGEVSEQTTHQARELGIHYLAAGHHATERYGVQALGRHLAERFGIRHQFVDIDNPV
jgi:dinuclear metal center YbgI/SA1388 family protein